MNAGTTVSPISDLSNAAVAVSTTVNNESSSSTSLLAGMNLSNPSEAMSPETPGSETSESVLSQVQSQVQDEGEGDAKSINIQVEAAKDKTMKDTNATHDVQAEKTENVSNHATSEVPEEDEIEIQITEKVTELLNSLKFQVEEESTSSRKASIENRLANGSVSIDSTQLVTPIKRQRPIRAIDVNSIRTPPQYQKNISLRGFINLNENLMDNSKLDDVFKINSDSLVEGDIGKWEGMWGMNDSAFVAPNGVLSPFQYSLKKTVDLLAEDASTDKPKIMVSGYFKLRSSLAPDKSNPYLEIPEDDVVLEFEKSTTDENKASVIGSGRNKYGLFRLFGEYNTQTSELNCYREYLKNTPKTKSKRKAAAGRSSLPKRPRPGEVPVPPVTTSPISAFHQPGTPMDISLKAVHDDFKPKRARKTPVHLQESLNMKTFKPLKRPTSLDNGKDKDVWDHMRGLLAKLVESDKEMWFTQPVDAKSLGLSDYDRIIKRPMDLGTISRKFHSEEYQDYLEMVKDIRLVFSNAMLYNPPKHPVHTVASMHLKLFERDFKAFEKEMEKLEKERAKKEQARMKAREKQRKEKAAKKSEERLQKQAEKARKQREKEMLESKKRFEQQSKLFLKSKQSLKSMFSSSDEEDDKSDDDSDNDSDSLTKQMDALKKEKKKKKKPKRRRSKSGDADMATMQKTVQMVTKQLEMMQQMQQANLMEINRLNQELYSERNRNSSSTNQPFIPQMPNNQMIGGTQGFGISNMMYNNQLASASTANNTTTRPKKEPKALTYQQKKELGDNMNRLPPEALPDMLKLLQESGADLGDGDEVELDIEKMDDSTLRKLQKFVSKALNKAKRTAAITEMRFDET